MYVERCQDGGSHGQPGQDRGVGAKRPTSLSARPGSAAVALSRGEATDIDASAPEKLARSARHHARDGLVREPCMVTHC
jgi:hypothetical protein